MFGLVRRIETRSDEKRNDSFGFFSIFRNFSYIFRGFRKVYCSVGMKLQRIAMILRNYASKVD